MRFVVIGISGSGKTTFARRLAARLGVRYVELDSIYWLPEWTMRDPEKLPRARRRGGRRGGLGDGRQLQRGA